MLLESVLADQVRKAFGSEGSFGEDIPEQSLLTVRLRVLNRVARILRLPFDPSDYALTSGGGDPTPFSSTLEDEDRLVLSDATLYELDQAWYRLTDTYSDRRVSSAERSVRERVFAKAPFYVSAKCLSRFVGVLAKRDAAHGSDATLPPPPTPPFDSRQEAEKAEEKEEIDADENAGMPTAGFSMKSTVYLLKSNVLNRLLAVDGFRGVLPSNYRNYVQHLHDRKNPVEKKHLEAVRGLYQSGGIFVEGRHSGTLSAACVFYTLLRLYSEKVGIRMEDVVRIAIERALENVSRFIRDHDEKQDFLSEKKFETLGQSYRKHIGAGEEDDEILEWIAFEKLKEYGQCVDTIKFLF